MTPRCHPLADPTRTEIDARATSRTPDQVCQDALTVRPIGTDHEGRTIMLAADQAQGRGA